MGSISLLLYTVAGPGMLTRVHCHSDHLTILTNKMLNGDTPLFTKVGKLLFSIHKNMTKEPDKVHMMARPLLRPLLRFGALMKACCDLGKKLSATPTDLAYSNLLYRYYLASIQLNYYKSGTSYLWK